MSQRKFGTILRQTRERKGMDLNAVARRLRIRPDILRAIEDTNFAAMPPRGYSRNMVNGYARYLGLNATEITSLYLDQLREYQLAISADNARPSGIDMSLAPDNTRIPRRQNKGLTGTQPRASRRSEDDYSGRTQGRQRVESVQGTGQNLRIQRDSGPRRNDMGSSRGYSNPGIPTSGNAYTQFYTGPAQRNKLPFIIGGIVLVVLIIVIAVFVLGGKGKAAEEEVATMPVTGVSNETQQASENASSSSAAVAPTSFTFEYSIPSGTTSWIEVWVDEVPEVAESVTGPSKKSFTSSGTIKFICANPTGVKATLDGADVALTPDDTGIVNLSMSLEEILKKWQTEHPSAAASSSSSSSSSSASSSGTTSSVASSSASSAAQ